MASWDEITRTTPNNHFGPYTQSLSGSYISHHPDGHRIVLSEDTLVGSVTITLYTAGGLIFSKKMPKSANYMRFQDVISKYAARVTVNVSDILLMDIVKNCPMPDGWGPLTYAYKSCGVQFECIQAEYKGSVGWIEAEISVNEKKGVIYIEAICADHKEVFAKTGFDVVEDELDLSNPQYSPQQVADALRNISDEQRNRNKKSD